MLKDEWVELRPGCQEGGAVTPPFVTPLPAVMSCPCGSAAEESACNAGDLGSIPGFRGSPEEGNVYPLQYSGHGEVHGVAELDTTGRLSLLSPLWWETRKGWEGAESECPRGDRSTSGSGKCKEAALGNSWGPLKKKTNTAFNLDEGQKAEGLTGQVVILLSICKCSQHSTWGLFS